jgi:hypothetical protein
MADSASWFAEIECPLTWLRLLGVDYNANTKPAQINNCQDVVSSKAELHLSPLR